MASKGKTESKTVKNAVTRTASAAKVVPRAHKQRHVLVLGAGPAGLGAALRLQERGLKVTLIEAKDIAGGAGASQRIKNCIVDYGPHLYHPSSIEINDLMKAHSGGKYYQRVMDNKIILKGKTFTYPFRLQEAAFKLNPFLNLRIVIDYLYVKTKQKIRPKPIKTFEDWGVQSFGKTLYNLCFGYYTARVWGRDPKTISARLAKEKLSALSLRKIVINFLLRKPQTEGYLGVREFGYHPDGIGAIYQNMAAHIRREGGEILYNTKLARMDVKNGHVHAITVRTGGVKRGAPGADNESESAAGVERTFTPDAIISTVPLTNMFEAMHVPESVQNHANALEYRDILFVNYLIKRNQYSSAHMIYLLDTHFTSNRVAEQKNAADKAAPKGRTVLCFEVPCQRGDELWKSEEEAYARTEKDLERLGVKSKEIADKFILRYVNAYPVFSLGYEVHLEAVKKYLSSYDNLYVAGRQGLYLNIDMHDSIRLGRLAADHYAERKSSKDWISHVNEFLASLKL